MERITLKEIVTAINGKILKKARVEEFNCLTTDSRKIEKGCIFLALKGENFNGNKFLVEASKKEASLCITDELCFDIKDVEENTTVVQVQDGKTALLDLAEYYKSRLDIKIVGITGSTGKTSTKDILAAMLSTKYKVFKTKGNFNNEIGVPLMIFSLDNSYNVAVLEMGMSDFGEIHRLAKAARPDIAIITNIGVSHIEFLKTRDNILQAKLEITDFFQNNNYLIVNGEDDLLSKVQCNNFEIFEIGFNKKNNLIASNVISDTSYSQFDIYDDENKYSFKIDIPGKHNILNTLLGIKCCKLLGLTYDEMKEGLKNIERTSMRLDITKLDNFTIIDDCYNASPDSMRAAIDVLSTFGSNRKIAILGTMKELGEQSYDMHKEVGKYLKEKNIDLLVASGDYTDAYLEGFGKKSRFIRFKNVDEILQNTVPIISQDDVILLKASRSEKFEKVVKLLKEKDEKGE